MVVLVLTAVPAGLRGHMTRWLMEISPGVFVGKLSNRVRDRLWEQVVEHCREGRAILVYRSRTEQGLTFRLHQSSWPLVDLDGLALVYRPDGQADEGDRRTVRRSNARNRRR